MKYLLDTNLLVHYIRNTKVWDYTEDSYFKKGLSNHACISEVSKGEIYMFALINKWQSAKKKYLKVLLNTIEVIPITPNITKNMYAEIGAYSQNHHKSLRLPKHFSARNMGKNDLWIVATANIYDIPLISTDRDFEHLDGVFLDFIYIDAAKILGLK